MKKSYHIHPIQIDLPQDKEIIYKKVDSERFTERGYKADYQKIKPNKQGYYSDSIVKSAKVTGQETVIINVGVGQGKSTSVTKLIKELSEENVVIIASPFITLVHKDFTYLTTRQKEDSRIDPIPEGCISDYRTIDLYKKGKIDIDDFTGYGKDWSFIEDLANNNIHLLTINSLLANPGDAAFEQAKLKREYLNRLLKLCKRDNRKVYFFFDEIHESIHNFTSEYIYYLRRWKEVTEKIFLLSATFTESVYPVAMHCAYLTNDNIRILESPRYKLKAQDEIKLQLYFTQGNYTSKDVSELDYIGELAAQAKEQNRKIHVLSYSEKIAKAIYEKEEWWEGLEIQYTTSKTDVEFDRKYCNIGTTFKTGVNITKADIFVIITPCKYTDTPTANSAGIFHDGFPSIIQSFARVRSQGDIYVFIPPAKKLIKGDYTDYLKINFPSYVKKVEIEESKPLNEEYELLKSLYKRLYDRVKEEHLIQKKAKEKHIQRPEIQYPTENNFILDKGQRYLVYSNLMSGKYISPFIIWAAFNNQFINCRLANIITHQYLSCDLHLNYNDYFETLDDFFANRLNFDIEELKELPIEELFYELWTNLKKINIGEDTYNLNVIFNGKPIGNFFKISLGKIYLLNYCYYLKGGSQIYFNDLAFFSLRIQDSDKVLTPNEDLAKLYNKLNKIVHKFYETVTKLDIGIPKKNYELIKNHFSTGFFYELLEVLLKIKENDFFFKYKLWEPLKNKTLDYSNIPFAYNYMVNKFLTLGKETQRTPRLYKVKRVKLTALSLKEELRVKIENMSFEELSSRVNLEQIELLKRIFPDLITDD